MSFTYNAPKSQPSTTPTSTAPTTSTFAFTFGATGAGDAAKPAGFSLTSTPAQSKPGGVFGTGLSSTPIQSTSFTFGTSAVISASTAVSQTGLTFSTGTTASTGITPAATTLITSTGFAAPAPVGSALNFNLGGTTTITTTTVATSAFASKPLTGGFALGGSETTASTAATGLTFGTPNTLATGTGFNLSATPIATTTTAATTTASGFSLTGVSSTTSAVTGFTFGTGTTSTSTAGFSLNQTAATASLTSTQVSLGTTTTVTSSATQPQPASINSFEESINKWTMELEEQEKVFVNQAEQVNAWDKLLISNGEKIVALNQEVERVKIEQQQLEHELDYVVGQQKELQDCLIPLEKELASLSVSDPEREYTYRLAEDLDTQLKRMSEDLKEIIEHLNQANRTQDSSDPIVQIGKILNAHMNSLQWLDQQTTLLNQKIQQIDQMHQNFRQENERSFSLAYN
ncbi:nuclear pore glycoprotein p62 isoform X1 [Frieseomelitta varia]|uniref:nuclear pore glycoprotein p62 isoform X1 n=1 Tax=Frieseomelitta varia TaxID=561572 RepID=UPI001CB6878C|nr:nuclear pore glycoprotein p62 isoform X1 [Frieseomelitta varia]XP_043520883.1 nuclear pore glycoprotein p62 isoform X1 [Frieseomelitta varia]XP_043520885.1 nuclear pore glycoprotein p62 isoform X1 [Frieseomelitta varia]XP_043520886.1 nuclear pore glycoprotein p62 isoform X1 [Frieseomelitta varia]